MTRRSKFSMTAILLALVGTTLLAGDFLMPRWLCRGGEWQGPVSDHFDGVFFSRIGFCFFVCFLF